MAGAWSYAAAGCSTEETILFDPSCPGGRCSALAGGTGGGAAATDCPADADPSCPIKFGEQIFKPLFDAEGKAKCANAACHGDPANVQGGIVLVPGNAVASRQALLDYQFDNPAGPYIKCSPPEASKILCNLSLGPMVPNPYGKCLTTMPLVDDVGAQRLTEDELELIKGWIACGAPNN